MKRPKHKKIFALLSMVMIFALLSGCGQKQPLTPSETERVSHVESSDNSFEARFNLTLSQLDDILNEHLCALGADQTQTLSEDSWILLEDHLIDDKNMEYQTFVLQMEHTALTAAVESESKKVMNIGCGCGYDDFFDEEKDLKDPMITFMAMTAAALGGYDDSELDSFYQVYARLIEQEKKQVLRESMIFAADFDEVDDSALLLLSAADETLAKERGVLIWNKTDFSDRKEES